MARRARPVGLSGQLRRAAMGLVVAAILLWLGEVGMRIAGVGPAYNSGTIAGWRTSAALGAHHLQGPQDGHGFLVTTNADGLRTTLPRARGPLPRIAIMGDSTVFGWGVDDGGTVADGLAAALAARGLPVEVLNAGQPGYSTVQAAWLYRETVRAYRPDLLIMFLALHDHNLVLVSDAELLRGAQGAAATVRVALAQHSRLYSALRGALFREAARPFLLPDMADGEPRVPRVSDVERHEALSMMLEAQRADGHELAVGLLPFLGDLTGAIRERVGVSWLKEWAAQHEVALADGRACCGTQAGHLVLPDDPGHLTAEGNHAAAAGIAEGVQTALRRGAPTDAGAGTPNGSLTLEEPPAARP